MGVEPASPAWKAGTSAARPRARSRRKERESNPQGSSLGRRPSCGWCPGGCHRQLACPSVCRSCGGRNRTCVGAVNSRLPVPARVPPQSKSGRRELNPHFCHGKAAGYRYIMGALRCAGLSKTKSTGRDSNPRRRMTTAAQRCPVRYPCRWTTSAFVSVGPDGLEPSPAWLRARYAAANTLIPSSASLRAQSGRGGSRTLSLTLIRGPL